ncbi:MAG: Nif3-like dinuclear metal center hexameric protein [Phycisphaeraceae bacterium]|nr:Nif3-like dinuclear metal center hexameric protein [Phycisphaeraceae bacterium]
MRLQTLIQAMETIAPTAGAEDWDNVGLLLGDPRWTLNRALLCIDLTPAVWDEAVRARAQLILAYHPPIFQPLKKLTAGHWQQRLLLDAARRRVAIYSPHTALDVAEQGLNDWLVRGLGQGKVRAIQSADATPVMVKIAVFVPREQVDRVRQAMADAGAGVIGHYRLCSFNSPGEGTFQGDDQANPFVGRAGRFERASEIRLEMVCPQSHVAAVVAAVRASHPYEEPAMDVYPLQHVPAKQPRGQGRVVELDKPVSLAALVHRAKKHLGLRHVDVTRPAKARPIRRVAVCAGAGASVLCGCDAEAYLTGEMRHHDLLDAAQRDVAVILAGHTQTERPSLPHLAQRLTNLLPKVRWQVSKADAPPNAQA